MPLVRFGPGPVASAIAQATQEKLDALATAQTAQPTTAGARANTAGASGARAKGDTGGVSGKSVRQPPPANGKEIPAGVGRSAGGGASSPTNGEIPAGASGSEAPESERPLLLVLDR